ncbi:hypothetical protein ACFQGX_48770 [Nonomuraea dietziae]|uniref:hypothetical protein n=1 Tax=Nonomuraea dietziae TaxID=65515 RepID=UPI00360ED01B
MSTALHSATMRLRTPAPTRSCSVKAASKLLRVGSRGIHEGFRLAISCGVLNAVETSQTSGNTRKIM